MQNINQIIPGLYIGNQTAAVNKQLLQSLNIGAVVNCTPDVPNALINQGVQYLRLTLDDSLKTKDINKMAQYLPHAVKFIHQNRLKCINVLVHCHAGIQRSATVVAAYLYQFYTHNLKRAIELIRQKRPVCFFFGTNINFYPSLIHFVNTTPLQNLPQH